MGFVDCPRAESTRQAALNTSLGGDRNRGAEDGRERLSGVNGQQSGSRPASPAVPIWPASLLGLG
jgi:hypothetical protein